MSIEVRKGQRLNFGERIAAHISDHCERNRVVYNARHPLQNRGNAYTHARADKKRSYSGEIYVSFIDNTVDCPAEKYGRVKGRQYR